LDEIFEVFFMFRRVALRCFSQGKTDKRLFETLQSELRHEGVIEKPEIVKSFISNGIWKVFKFNKIKDAPGSKEAVISRDFGNEKISVIASTDSITNAEPEFDEQPEEPVDETNPISVTILIEKPTSGALEISASVEGSSFFVDNVSHFKDAKLAVDDSADADWKRSSLYAGPVFEELDPTVVENFHDYLEERGLSSDFAQFLSEYLEYKEQKEYSNWLKSVSEFVNE
jgi:complement component 1 Q subcomponent-binding protein